MSARYIVKQIPPITKYSDEVVGMWCIVDTTVPKTACTIDPEVGWTMEIGSQERCERRAARLNSGCPEAWDVMIKGTKAEGL